MSEPIPSGEARNVRLKRLHMRSMRRGIKEMDIILMRFSAIELEKLSDAELDEYDAVLSQNDQDLYQWVSGQMPAPAPLAPMIARIARVSDEAMG
ncbi:succinate dehydrogenase assembly factor 2 [Pseudooceanicola sp. CBS1P-1]|uniref:FAD assembly factor SdhE n=1 Tax=Pseudooceanicola albus TaxID=2692189 RepID=A0A6L7G021_9RHOB|nr:MULTISPECIES: succinate dehydrogenase assembly factor 2 [Pseudooceanicola]MBT9382741.1 succinate dehydrogenase assembly factor 2 [Pseudooceanicola endophyticus]MXN17279.1 succinate dehydrogenase assembly factor 2 [Pseudooceanicola albus]